MNSEKIALVVQRYGLDVNGGAEYHCRVLAEHLLSVYQVDVLTSCSRDYLPWDNYYKAGAEEINGVMVIRFPVDEGRGTKTSELFNRMKEGRNKAIETEWMEETGPYCPEFISYMKVHVQEYKAIIFITYTHWFTMAGLQLDLRNSILLPTAHDEPNIHLPMFEELFTKPEAILYNSIEERDFLINKFGIGDKPSRLTCVGIDISDERKYAMPEHLIGYQDNYIVYVGRVSWAKNFHELSRYFVEYKMRNPSDLKLIVVGRIDERTELLYSKDIIYAGFVSEEEKTAIVKNAKLLVMPSMFESLSLVILESMAVKRPVLVNGNCAVLKGQCIRSNAGLYYTNYLEFEAALNYILSNRSAYNQMCENGYRFVKDNYDWDVITANVKSLIEEL